MSANDVFAEIQPNLAASTTVLEEEDREFSRSAFLLVYKDYLTEKRFLEYATPHGPAVAIFMVIGTLVALAFVFLNGGLVDQRNVIVFIFTMSFVPVTVWVVAALARFKSNPTATTKSRYQNAQRFGGIIIVTVLSIMGIAAWFAVVRSGCDNSAQSVGQGGKAYQEANCSRFVYSLTLGFQTVMFLMRLPFRYFLANAAVVIVTVITVILMLASSSPVPYQVLGLHIAGFILHGALRHRVESTERAYFEAAAKLEIHGRTLEQRKQHLADFCRNAIPVAVMNRLEASKGKEVMDESPEAAVLSVAIYDFAKISTELREIELAHVTEEALMTLRIVCGARGLQPIAAMHDEFIAVSNLIGLQARKRASQVRGDVDELSPMGAYAAAQCCDAALHIITAERSRRQSLNPPLHAAVTSGHAYGGFVGTTWIRYGVFGAAVAECCALRVRAPANSAVVSKRTADLLGGFCSTAADVPDPDQVVPMTETDDPLESGDTNLIRLVAAHVPDPPSTSGNNTGGNQGEASSSTSSYFANSKTDQNPLASMSRYGALAVKEEANADEAARADDSWADIDQGCLFDKFVNPETESQFLNYRLSYQAPQATYTWLAYSAFLLAVLVLTLVDLQNTRMATAGVVLYTVTIVLCVAAGIVPAAASREVLIKLSSIWSFTATVLPLVVIISLAMTRPGAVGNDLRGYTCIAALVRSSCFFETKYQIVAKPLMLILSQLHILLPGGVFRLGDLSIYFVVLWSAVVDGEFDRAERRHFVVLRQAKSVVSALEEQERVRWGLLRSTLPPQLFALLNEFGPDSRLTVPQERRFVEPTTILLVSRQCSKGAAEKDGRALLADQNHWLANVEAALASFETDLSVLDVFGDQLLILAPVVGAGEFSTIQNTIGAMHVGLCLHQRDESIAAVVEADGTLQVTSKGLIPTFSVFGVGVTRMLALASSSITDTIRGVHATERAVRILGDTAEGTLAFSQGNRWRVRGAGMLRLHSVKTAATN